MEGLISGLMTMRVLPRGVSGPPVVCLVHVESRSQVLRWGLSRAHTPVKLRVAQGSAVVMVLLRHSRDPSFLVPSLLRSQGHLLRLRDFLLCDILCPNIASLCSIAHFMSLHAKKTGEVLPREMLCSTFSAVNKQSKTQAR